MTMLRMRALPGACVVLPAIACLCSAETWRHWQANDGLPDSYTTAITLDPKGNVWAKHGDVSAMSLLTGYEVQRLPAAGRVYETKLQVATDGTAWVKVPGAIARYVNGAWQNFKHRELSVSANGLAAIDRNTALVLLPDRIAQFDAASASMPTFSNASDMGVGKLLSMHAKWGGGYWITGTRGVGILTVDSEGSAHKWVRISSPLRLLTISNDCSSIRMVALLFLDVSAMGPESCCDI